MQVLGMRKTIEQLEAELDYQKKITELLLLTMQYEHGQLTVQEFKKAIDKL